MLLISSPQQCDDLEPLKQETYKTCGKCKAVFYCPRECQTKDWKPRHAAFCQRYIPLTKVAETEPAAGSSSVQNLSSEAYEELIADIQEAVVTHESPTKRKKKKRNKKRKAKNTGENNDSVPSQSQTGPPDDTGPVEDAESAKEIGGPQSPSNTTPHDIEPVEPVEPV